MILETLRELQFILEKVHKGKFTESVVAISMLGEQKNSVKKVCQSKHTPGSRGLSTTIRMTATAPPYSGGEYPYEKACQGLW